MKFLFGTKALASVGAPFYERRRGSVFYLVLAVFMGVDLFQIFLPMQAAPGLTTPRIIGLAALGVFTLIALLYRFTNRHVLCSGILLTTAYIGLTYAAFKQGGSPAPTLAYAPFMPLMATVLIGRIGGLVATAASIAAIGLCTYAGQAGLATPSPHTPDEMRLLFASAFILLSAAVAVYAFIYESLIADALEETAATKEALRRQADELAESKEFLSTVLECSHDGVIAVAAEGKFNVFNRAAREFHGLESGPLLEGEWPQTYNLYDGDGRTRLELKDVPLVRAMRGEKLNDFEMAVCNPGENTRFFMANAAPLYDKSFARKGAVVTLREITREKRQEDELRRQNREIEQFARVASADLQTPLNRIVNTADALLADPLLADAGRIRKELAAVSASAKKMGSLIKDVLYMSRLPIGELAMQPVAARDCIDAAIEFAGVNEADCRLDFRFGGSPDVFADPRALTKVYTLLIENAWRSAPAGEKAHIEFTASVEDGFAILGLRDNGPQMSPEQIARLFLPLERLPTDADDDGAMLGLAICRKSVLRLGGEFWVESTPGEGRHFRMRLPLAAAGAALAS